MAHDVWIVTVTSTKLQPFMQSDSVSSTKGEIVNRGFRNEHGSKQKLLYSPKKCYYSIKTRLGRELVISYSTYIRHTILHLTSEQNFYQTIVQWLSQYKKGLTQPTTSYNNAQYKMWTTPTVDHAHHWLHPEWSLAHSNVLMNHASMQGIREFERNFECLSTICRRHWVFQTVRKANNFQGGWCLFRCSLPKLLNFKTSPGKNSILSQQTSS